MTVFQRGLWCLDTLGLIAKLPVRCGPVRRHDQGMTGGVKYGDIGLAVSGIVESAITKFLDQEVRQRSISLYKCERPSADEAFSVRSLPVTVGFSLQNKLLG